MAAASAPPPPPPQWLVNGTEVTYRSSMLGLWGIVVRFAQMPLERLALIANSSKVDAMPERWGTQQYSASSTQAQQQSSQLLRAARLVVKDGWLAPWRVVTARSCVAWFLQYSMIGAAFQVSDRMLSAALGVSPFVYGDELFHDGDEGEGDGDVASATVSKPVDPLHLAKVCSKAFLAPTLAAIMESLVSNKAEVERFYGKKEFKRIVTATRAQRGALGNLTGPAFNANVARNGAMSFTTFIGTPLLFTKMIPEDHKNAQNLAWFGLCGNLVANVLGTTCQSAWGRSLDFLAQEGHLSYREMIHQGLQSGGVGAFVNPTKWITRVGMNLVPQGMIPWYYNTIVPLGEIPIKRIVFSSWSRGRGGGGGGGGKKSF
jgi:hypothetical protein